MPGTPSQGKNNISFHTVFTMRFHISLLIYKWYDMGNRRPLTSGYENVTVFVDGTIPWGWAPLLIKSSGIHHCTSKLLHPLHIWLPLFLPVKNNIAYSFRFIRSEPTHRCKSSIQVLSKCHFSGAWCQRGFHLILLRLSFVTVWAVSLKPDYQIWLMT